jgi:hypothetical protein
MKLAFRISFLLNLALFGGLIFAMASRQKEAAASPPPAPPAASPASVATPMELPKPFRWSQLLSTNDYRIFVANLRAIGCPEPTIHNIVSGDARFAFALKRKQLGLDASASGPWSQQREDQMVAAMMGEQPPMADNSGSAQSSGSAPQQNAGTAVAGSSASMQDAAQNSPAAPASVPAYPLAYQNMNLDAIGFSATQKAAVAQAQQQFMNDVGDPNQNPSDPASLAKWQTAQSSADDTLRALLGTQAYMAYEQQLYYEWYQPQVQAAVNAGEPVIINPALFSKSK